MSLASVFCHHSIRLSQEAEGRRFRAGAQRIRAEQERVLKETLAYLDGVGLFSAARMSSARDFQSLYPVTDYTHYREKFSELKRRRPLPRGIRRFQPTSGSSDSIKWIPYTDRMLTDLDRALAPWLSEMYRLFPETKRGRHYWSLSWLPTDLRREGVSLDDTQLFPFWKTILLRSTMAVRERVDLVHTSEASRFATLAYLAACRDLSFVSVWSPTYWLGLMEDMRFYRNELRETLQTGRWQFAESDLKPLTPPQSRAQAERIEDPRALWPDFKHLSCWTTASSAPFAASLKEQFSFLNVHGKGLWATEGAVTIPYGGRYVLAYRSHFFEFRDLETDRIFSSWDLKQGQFVSPILTTSSGLLRYELSDRLEVRSFFGEVPCFEFLGRTDGADIAGEKISYAVAEEIVSGIRRELGIERAFVLAVSSQNEGYYCVVADGEPGPRECNREADVAKLAERILQKSFHYRVARELKQLGHSRALFIKDPWVKYGELARQRGVPLGNVKPDPLRVTSEHEFKEVFCDIATS